MTQTDTADAPTQNGKGNPKKVPAARRKRPSRPVVEALPDALGTAGNAEIVADLLANVQQQIKRLDSIKVLNAASDDDPAPGLPVGPGGEITTYADRRRDLLESQDRLIAANPESMDAVRKLLKLKERQAQQTLSQADEE